MDPHYLALLLYVAAVALAVVDLFVPSGGLLLILSAVGGVAAVLFGFRSGTGMGMGMLTLVIASIPTFVLLAIKVWPHTPIGRRIILPLPRSASPAETNTGDSLGNLVGRVMRAETTFLPTGQLRIGHRRFNALAESGFIEAGSHVKVIAVRERNLIVRVTTEPLTHTSPRPAGHEAAEDAAAEQSSLLERPAEELGLDSLDN